MEESGPNQSPSETPFSFAAEASAESPFGNLTGSTAQNSGSDAQYPFHTPFPFAADEFAVRPFCHPSSICTTSTPSSAAAAISRSMNFSLSLASRFRSPQVLERRSPSRPGTYARQRRSAAISARWRPSVPPSYGMRSQR